MQSSKKLQVIAFLFTPFLIFFLFEIKNSLLSCTGKTKKKSQAFYLIKEGRCSDIEGEIDHGVMECHRSQKVKRFFLKKN